MNKTSDNVLILPTVNPSPLTPAISDQPVQNLNLLSAAKASAESTLHTAATYVEMLPELECYSPI